MKAMSLYLAMILFSSPGFAQVLNIEQDAEQPQRQEKGPQTQYYSREFANGQGRGRRGQAPVMTAEQLQSLIFDTKSPERIAVQAVLGIEEYTVSLNDQTLITMKVLIPEKNPFFTGDNNSIKVFFMSNNGEPNHAHVATIMLGDDVLTPGSIRNNTGVAVEVPKKDSEKPFKVWFTTKNTMEVYLIPFWEKIRASRAALKK